MNYDRAVDLLENTFANEFDLNRFSSFISELFNHFKVSVRDISFKNEYYDYVDKLQSLGVYRDENNDVLEVFVVKLKKSSSRDRARTMQRNLIATYLKKFNRNGALVAFYDDSEDWRFSFVKIEYNLIKDESGNLKVLEELTPATRYSFLVGENEPNYTCKKRFLPLILEERIDPDVDQIQNQFSVEKVTKKFYTEYENLYKALKKSLEESIENDEDILQEFEDKIIRTSDFAKKLMGQIVFVYFLQKKGWLGVEKGKEWCTGSKKFLRNLFKGKIVEYDNFFDEVLEPFFYNALSVKWDDDYYPPFKCKIPFLNGGLFEPINDYDWENTQIRLKNDIFKEIFEVFDRYNFTVKEDEPLEKEVAVDPEMLGKVFENLLDVEERKNKGAFYTPREIVHYMCQESLINYLDTNSNLSRDDLENFIKFGDFASASIIKEQEQIKKYGRSYERKILSESISENHKELDKLLTQIKIADPAVGSGAFPVGMMNEIIKARSILSLYSGEHVSNYDLKLETIENSLYGVDIDSSAVDVTKLRFWLSLIVDENDPYNIDPLPNLDHKIMCGNSLLEEFEGKKLFDDKLLLTLPEDKSMKIKEIQNLIDELHRELGEIFTGKNEDEDRKNQIKKEIKKLQRKKKNLQKHLEEDTNQFTLDQSFNQRAKNSQNRLKDLRKLIKIFFKEQNANKKKKLGNEIDKIEWELIEETLSEDGNKEAMEKLEEYKKNKSKPFFLWKLYFYDVFQRENPGFDVVIGNPPYGFRNVLTKEEKEYFRKIQKVDFRSGDSAELFCKVCFDRLVRKEGILTFIIPKKSLYGDSWKGLRNDYWQKYNLLFILDSSKSFDKVLLEASAFGLQKNNDNKDVILSFLNDNKIKVFSETKKESIYMDNGTVQIYKILHEDLFRKIESKGTFGGLIEGNLGLAIGKKFYSDDPQEYKLLKGIDIERWAIKSHRYLKNKEELKWEVAKKFLKPKVIAQRIIAHIENPFPHIKIMATLDLEGILITNTLMSFELDEKISSEFWLAYLNSSFVSWYAYNFIYSRAIRTMDFYNFYIQQLPIPKIIIENKDKQKAFKSVVNEINQVINGSNKDEDNESLKKLEEEINKLVYELYDLTSDEIKIIENQMD